MKRILMLTSTLPRTQQDTSIARFVFDLAHELSHSHQYRIRILAPHIPGTPTYEIWDGVEIVRYRYFLPGMETLATGGMMSKVRKNPLYLIQVPFLLSGMLGAILWQRIRFRPDLIHAHWIFPQGLMARIGLIGAKKPFVVTSHGSDISQLNSRIFQKLYRWILKKTDVYTVVSNSLCEATKSMVDTQPRVIPMGIDSGFFEYSDIPRRNQIISVGRLDGDKGFQDVIRALPKLSDEIQYVIVGEGNYREELDALAEELRVSERVQCVGSKSHIEIKLLYDISKVFIHPSRHEGVGLVVLEAMASGIPVITSDIPALRQHTQRGGGISINTQDTDLLSKTIQEALVRVDTTSIQKAQEYAKTFEWKQVGKRFHEVYQECL